MEGEREEVTQVEGEGGGREGGREGGKFAPLWHLLHSGCLNH